MKIDHLIKRVEAARTAPLGETQEQAENRRREIQQALHDLTNECWKHRRDGETVKQVCERVAPGVW